MEALRAELPATALERIAVPVLAGQVDDHLLARGDQVGSERVRREHRVAAGVVGDREDVDARIGGELARDLDHAAAARRGDQAAAGHELGCDDERARPFQLLAKGHVVAFRPASDGGLHAPALGV